MNLLINIKDLFFGYEDNPVLKGVNLEIEKGEFVAFIGPNGSGKTTLMQLIIGSLRPNKGQVMLNNIPAHKFNDWDKISYLSQGVKNFNNSFPATVKEMIAANLYGKMGFFKIMNQNNEKLIDKALKKVDMLEYKNRQIGNLSGGQKQRVFLARGLSTNPELILLDEPMAGVDMEAQEDLYHLLNKLNQEGITLVMISHDIHVISEYVNKIVCFGNKKIYSHRKEDFDYESYLAQKEGQKRFIKEHSH